MHKSAIAFLNLLLNFHSKTRTLHAYSNALLDACTSLPSITSLASPRDIYGHAHTSAIIGHIHLSSLAQALRTFLTPTQVKEAAQISSTLQEKFDAYQNLSSLIKTSEVEPEDRPRKKRRKSEPAASPASSAPAKDTREIDACALSLSLTLKFAALFLSNLPSSFVTAEIREAVREAGAWAIEASLSLLCKMSSKISWADQVTGAALLRFAYHLPAWKYVEEPGDIRGLLEVVKVEEVEGELVLEIVCIISLCGIGRL
jgi:hypothetical protein